MEDGIGAALETAFRISVSHSRRSGRTSRTIERANPGDVIVVRSMPEQRRMRQLLAKAGKADVRVLAFEPNSLERHWHRLRNAAVHFDHSWVEALYEWRLAGVHRELAELGKLAIPTRKHEADIRYADLYGAITFLSGERPIRFDP